MPIYILLSIKTRIETYTLHVSGKSRLLFISYYPLKQGLKLRKLSGLTVYANAFISYYPLKQGLKLLPNASIIAFFSLFISYYPLKQGLKLSSDCFYQRLADNDLYPTIH